MFSHRDYLFLSEALSLSHKGGTAVRPNPRVGAIIVKDGEVVAEGYHSVYGGPHAESIALDIAGQKAYQSTLYCNLEPCSFSAVDKHNGPCTHKIIQAGVERVVIGQLDPNRRVHGKGVAQLRKAGITVEVCPDEFDSREILYSNSRFNTVHSLNRPFVSLKLAQSIDGKIATITGDSKWITDITARGEVHRMRADHDAVLVGIGTVIMDDPRLTARLLEPESKSKEYDPYAAVLDPEAKLPITSYLVRKRADRLLLFVSNDSNIKYSSAQQLRAFHKRVSILQKKGVTVLPVPSKQRGELSLTHILDDLEALRVQAILIEGGAQISTAFLRQNLFDAVHFYIAPFLIGGDGIGLDSLGVKSIADSLIIERVRAKNIGAQIVISGFRTGWFEDINRALAERDYVYRTS